MPSCSMLNLKFKESIKWNLCQTSVHLEDFYNVGSITPFLRVQGLNFSNVSSYGNSFNFGINRVKRC